MMDFTEGHPSPKSDIRVKICGITSAEDALLAVDAGANYLGLILVPQSPRCLSLEVAQAIRSEIRRYNNTSGNAPVKIVGVFQNHYRSEVIRLSESLALDYIQLHGEETPDFCAEMPSPVIKFFPLTLHQTDLSERIDPYRSVIEAALLEPPKGSGETTLQWLQAYPQQIRHLESVLTQLPCFLAGGLTVEQLAPIFEWVKPAVVDVASGVEKLPGVKDAEKMRRFCREVVSFSRQDRVHFADSGETFP